jgi:hypothetical protein
MVNIISKAREPVVLPGRKALRSYILKRWDDELQKIKKILNVSPTFWVA